MKIKNTYVKSITICIALSPISCSHFNQYTPITTESEMSIVVQNHKNDRGGSILNSKYLLDSSCPLVYKKRFSNLETLDEVYFLAQLIPYQLQKIKGDNQFFIIKENDTLIYKLL
ncbi:hypothetical protein SCB49_04720 [unidentified eubacterium SCB49]|nr:hypothetical protein SCB49_04720 [unidentified eubacterium SCB49]